MSFVQHVALLTLLSVHASAVPIPTPFERATNDPQPLMTSTKRTLINIIWNCVSTTIICAWVSMHPNIPPSGRWRALYRRLEMMLWTIIAPELIVACAVRQWFGAREVRDIYNKVNGKWESKRWNMDHGYFLNMGGLIRVSDDIHSLKEPEEPNPAASGIMKAAYMSRRKDYKKWRESCELGVLTLEHLEELIQDPNYNFPVIPAAELTDRSKGDALSKSIAILQTTWFILQCVARGQQRLALTEIELVTLALASLNAITYAFWWHKPLGVQEPMKIYFKTTTEVRKQLTRLPSDGMQDISVKYVISQVGKRVRSAPSHIFQFLRNPCEDFSNALATLFIGIPITLFIIFSLCLFLPFPLGIIVLLKILKTNAVPLTEEPRSRRGLLAARIVFTLQKFRYRLTSYIAGVSEMWLRKLFKSDGVSADAFFVGWLFLLPALFFILLAVTISLLPLFTLLFLVSFVFNAVFGIITSSTVTPGATHVPSFYAPSTKSDKYSRMVVFAFFGVIFGGLHCIGWNFTYPTPFEQHLWRATSLAITVIPFIVAPIDYILENFRLDKGRLSRIVRLTLDLVMTVLLFIYVPARLSLIAQALALLRNQPEAAFLIVDWTRYIPHIF